MLWRSPFPFLVLGAITLFGGPCRSDDWVAHKDWFWTKNPVNGYAEAYTPAQGTNNVFATLVFPTNGKCQQAVLALEDGSGQLRKWQNAKIGFRDTEYAYGNGSTTFSTFLLSRAELQRLKNQAAFTVTINQREFRFSLKGSAAAINAAWAACNTWVSKSSTPIRNAPDLSDPSANQGRHSITGPVDNAILEASIILLFMGLVTIWLARRYRAPLRRHDDEEKNPEVAEAVKADSEEELRVRETKARREKAAREKQEAFFHQQQERERQERERQERERQERERQERERLGTRYISCPSCRRKVRIRLPLTSSLARCAACSGRFSVALDEQGNLYIESLRDRSADAEATSDEIRNVSDCFSVLELPEGASKEMIKKAYQRKIRAYHPDKVSTLGDRLQKVAEIETKKLNQAMRLLRQAGYL